MLRIIFKPIRVFYYLIRRILMSLDIAFKYYNYRKEGRPISYSETFKAKSRRVKEGFFENYCKGQGVDIGYGGDLICSNARGIDIEHGDATYIKPIIDLKFNFVYSSHLLEHIQDIELAIKNWWDIVDNEGYLILFLPHRDLYEKKKCFPSRFNADHKHFFLLDKDEEPDTVGVLSLIEKTIDNYTVVYAKICDENYRPNDVDTQADGEYSIEVVLKKQLI